MKDYSEYTNEELVSLISQGEEAAYAQLFSNMKPITVREAAMYRGKMPTYDTEDFVQEGQITIWKIISRGNFKGGNFASYFTRSIRFRLCNIYRDYCLKNPITLAEKADEKGEGFNKAILAEAAYAEAYREKHRRHCRESYQRKKEREAEARRAAWIPEPEPRKKQAREERIAKQVAYQNAYYEAHPDKLAERREKNRIRERERRAAKKAAALAATNT